MHYYNNSYNYYNLIANLDIVTLHMPSNYKGIERA